MEQQDYLKKQIDRLGQVLGKILAECIGFKNAGQIQNGMEWTNQALQEAIGRDTDELLRIPTSEFVSTLLNEKQFTPESLEQLADILFHLADNRPEHGKAIYEKCLAIYRHLEATDNVYSMDRQWKIERLENLL
jgi:hypothetical protein